ncbi:MAG: hypothetical protein KUG79_03580 [Pseudomonadales bacterium]|nr:hypothetical protein [Pseudomonadales bacterium]
MKPEAETKSWASQHTGPLITAVATIFAALIGGAFLLASQKQQDDIPISSPKYKMAGDTIEKSAPLYTEKSNKTIATP